MVSEGTANNRWGAHVDEDNFGLSTQQVKTMLQKAHSSSKNAGNRYEGLVGLSMSQSTTPHHSELADHQRRHEYAVDMLISQYLTANRITTTSKLDLNALVDTVVSRITQPAADKIAARA